MIDSAGTEWSRVPGSTERGLNKDGSTKSQGHHASHFPKAVNTIIALNKEVELISGWTNPFSQTGVTKENALKVVK